MPENDTKQTSTAMPSPAPAAPAPKPDPAPPPSPAADPDPKVTASPLAADGERQSRAEPSTFVGYPVTKYHPVFGKRVANDPNEAHSLFQPATDWFNTPGEADMHRTDAEAQQAIHHNRHVKHRNHLAQVEGRDPEEIDGPVRNSVQAQESLDAGHPEPL